MLLNIGGSMTLHDKMLKALWQAWHLLNHLDARAEHKEEIAEIERVIVEAEREVVG